MVVPLLLLLCCSPLSLLHAAMQWRWLIARHPEHAQSAKTLVELLAPFASMDDKIEMAHRLPDTGGDPVAAVLDMFTLDLLQNNDLRHMRWREVRGCADVQQGPQEWPSV